MFTVRRFSTKNLKPLLEKKISTIKEEIFMLKNDINNLKVTNIKLHRQVEKLKLEQNQVKKKDYTYGFKN